MEAQIVLVEDERIIAMLLNKMFEDRGHKVIRTFSIAEDALDFIRDNKVDAVLLDIYLKGEINGIDAAKQLRSISDAVIIFITANADPTAKDLALQTDQSGYFEKPLSDNEIDEICDIIKRKLD